LPLYTCAQSHGLCKLSKLDSFKYLEMSKLFAFAAVEFGSLCCLPQRLTQSRDTREAISSWPARVEQDHQTAEDAHFCKQGWTVPARKWLSQLVSRTCLTCTCICGHSIHACSTLTHRLQSITRRTQQNTCT
jgi:hypothetical protein